MAVVSNLSCVLDANVRDTERVNSPIQVEGLLRLPKRQPFSQSSLVDLDNINTSLLEILNLVLDGQSNLVTSLKPGRQKHTQKYGVGIAIRKTNKQTILSWKHYLPLLPWLVDSNKGPVENGDRASKHSLHRAGCHALSCG